MLLVARLKFNPPRLAFVAVWILVVHWVDLYWLVMPALHPEGFTSHWTGFTSFVGVGGVAVAFARWRAARPLHPAGQGPLPGRLAEVRAAMSDHRDRPSRRRHGSLRAWRRQQEIELAVDRRRGRRRRSRIFAVATVWSTHILNATRAEMQPARPARRSRRSVDQYEVGIVNQRSSSSTSGPRRSGSSRWSGCGSYGWVDREAGRVAHPHRARRWRCTSPISRGRAARRSDAGPPGSAHARPLRASLPLVGRGRRGRALPGCRAWTSSSGSASRVPEDGRLIDSEGQPFRLADELAPRQAGGAGAGLLPLPALCNLVLSRPDQGAAADSG